MYLIWIFTGVGLDWLVALTNMLFVHVTRLDKVNASRKTPKVAYKRVLK